MRVRFSILVPNYNTFKPKIMFNNLKSSEIGPALDNL